MKYTQYHKVIMITLREEDKISIWNNSRYCMLFVYYLSKTYLQLILTKKCAKSECRTMRINSAPRESVFWLEIRSKITRRWRV